MNLKPLINLDLEIGFIGIIIAYGLSLFFLYTRKKKWMPAKLVWAICIALSIVAIIGISNTEALQKEKLLMFHGFYVPLIYWSFDRIFKQLSLRFQKRDFLLYLRKSGDINDGPFNYKNPQVKMLDIVFSFGLVAIIVLSIFIGVYFIQQ